MSSWGVWCGFFDAKIYVRASVVVVVADSGVRL
jgi:hypothetical protein